MGRKAYAGMEPRLPGINFTKGWNMKLKTLVLTRQPGETLVFSVDKPCTFAITRVRGRRDRLSLHIPEAVQVQRSEIVTAGSIASEMLADIEAKNDGEPRRAA